MSTSNVVSLFLPLDLRLLIQQDCANSGRLPATVILSFLTEHYKDRLPKEVYDQLKEQYERTALEQRDLKNLRAQAQQENKENLDEKARRSRLRVLANLISQTEFNIKQHPEADGLKTRLQKLKEEKAFLETRAPEPESIHKTGIIHKRKT